MEKDETVDLSSQDLAIVPDFILYSPHVKKLVLDFNDISDLPADLCQTICQLSYLSLNGNNLEYLPSNIDLLKELAELYMKENSLQRLPNELCNLSKLLKLHLTGNQVKEFPDDFHQLQSLSELVADENEIIDLPVNFGNLTCLSRLDLSNNCLKALPNSFGNLTHLKELDLSNNDLKCLPKSFSELPSLEILALTNNEISELPDRFLSAKTLRKILMSENSLTGLPPWLSDAENLEEMCFAANDLYNVALPADFGVNNRNLVVVDLSGNNINELLDSFGKLEKLKCLDLGSSFDELERNRMIANGNKLRHLPESFTNLQSLVKLELDENELYELPLSFGQLTGITYLDLCHNNLKLLPDSFCMLTNMKICLLSMNYITELPLQFGMLTAVEELKLDNNLIVELPSSFTNMTNLTSLDLYNNSLKAIPSILSELKKLKHLDLRENDFGLPIEEIPDITFEPTYLKRKEEFADTWRGRKRPDIIPSSWVELKTESQKTDLNEDVIYSALTSSSSLFRKHGQIDNRQKSPKAISDASTKEVLKQDVELTEPIVDSEVPAAEMNGLSINTTESECWDNDFYENIKSKEDSDCNSDDTYSERSCDSCSTSSDQDQFIELSDWESDTDDYTNIPSNFNKIYRHPAKEDKPDMNILIPSDIHANPIKKTEIWQLSEEGQFDDADL